VRTENGAHTQDLFKAFPSTLAKSRFGISLSEDELDYRIDELSRSCPQQTPKPASTSSANHLSNTPQPSSVNSASYQCQSTNSNGNHETFGHLLSNMVDRENKATPSFSKRFSFDNTHNDANA
jgi:hypothetical protein